MMKRPVKFNTKVFISFNTVFIWIILFVAGIVLYLSPPGRIAKWVEWKILELTKTNWQSVFTTFSFSFILTGSLHLYFNWVLFRSYLKSKTARALR
jgi:hypothetical protein